MNQPFISLDWGTSNLRATLVSAQGWIVGSRSAEGGVMAVKDGQFLQSFNSLCSDWIADHGCPIIASGMIGSRQGWVEAPYVDCPATPASVARSLTSFPLSDRVTMHIIPGLRCGAGTRMYDVMRGEETQIWGADVGPDTICVLPGTHSKWALVGEQSRIRKFATYMTGELYGLLTKHGILGRLMQFGASDHEAFVAGAQLGLDDQSQATHVIFAARTAGLMDEVPPAGLPDYLSGILIGLEVKSARERERIASAAEKPVTLIGDDSLCQRYETVLRLAGFQSVRAGEGATVRGHIRIATEAGIMERASA
ncbi:2-dehydro-3-deoxygalactonokinase [Paraburkholderia agricolaris]|jgi:2-dehydro-3-deoxygalactonokinase|uniref:2-dehydro-3-deoxygalactonokinase n=1 Tax=Paraburkholderia agricolaris TaxID=2152888 RepID=UPI0012924951|nr:2-dehydro-3-deoxygalactonokinase [Paraburkholderia agricolaris]